MTDEDIVGFNDKVTEKLGKEQASIISDDIGILITKHTETKKHLEEQEKRIADLEATNEKLVNANATLLRQVPMGTEPKQKSEPKNDMSNFNLRDAFDEKGNFVK